MIYCGFRVVLFVGLSGNFTSLQFTSFRSNEVDRNSFSPRKGQPEFNKENIHFLTHS